MSAALHGAAASLSYRVAIYGRIGAKIGGACEERAAVTLVPIRKLKHENECLHIHRLRDLH